MTIRVLIVDDSAFARKVLREVLSAAGDIEVVGMARDGLEALEKIAELKPDVITLDLIMPNLDGLGVLQSLPSQSPPRVVVVSISDQTSELALRALEAGAVDLVPKPTALATGQLYELGGELIAKVRAAAVARPLIAVAAAPATRTRATAVRHDVVVIGTSTGGPQALNHLLPALPADFPVPIVVALHIPAGYTDSLATRLDERCAITVVEASSGLSLKPGVAVIARGGAHLLLRRGRNDVVTLIEHNLRGLLYVPSVDLLFESAVEHFQARVLGVVLTGMGDDGTVGSRAIRQAGGTVLTEARDSAVIYGMPRSVTEAGFSSEEAPLGQLAARIVKHL